MKAGLIWPRGRVHISNNRNPVFQECCFFTGIFFAIQARTIFCCSVVRTKEHSVIVLTVSNMLRFWKGCSMSIILHILCRNIGFSKRGTAPLKGGLDMWKCTLRSFKGHGATFQWILMNHESFIFCLDIAPAKTHGIAPKEDYSYSEGYDCFEYCICWQVWGCCNYVEVI